MRISRRMATALVSVALMVALAASGCSSGDADSTSDGGTTPDSIEQDGLEVGTKAPGFRLKNQDQATVVLSDYLGVSNVILVFYPLAFTPV